MKTKFFMMYSFNPPLLLSVIANAAVPSHHIFLEIQIDIYQEIMKLWHFSKTITFGGNSSHDVSFIFRVNYIGLGSPCLPLIRIMREEGFNFTERWFCHHLITFNALSCFRMVRQEKSLECTMRPLT